MSENISPKDKYQQIIDGTYNDPSTPAGKYNYNFSQGAERYVGETLGEMIPEDESEWDMQDSTMTARAFIDGLWLNKSEEVGSWIAAGAYKLFGGYGSEDKSVTDIRNEMLGMLEAESAQFMEERPGVSLTANIAGGILSPVSLKGGQILSKAGQIRKAEQARQAQAGVRASTSGLISTTGSPLGTSALGAGEASVAAGRNLAQQMSGFGPRAYNIAAQTRTPALAIGATAAESAIIGAEGDNMSERLENAVKSAALGTVFSGGLSLTGMFVNKALQSNIAQQIGKGSDFIPLMFTDHFLSPVYSHVISKAFGAKTLMEQQARRVTSRIRSVGELKEQGVNLVEGAKKRLNQAKRIIGADREKALEEAKILADEVKNDLTAKNTVKMIDLDDVSRSRVETLEAARNNTLEEVQAAAVKEADEAVNALESGFRSKVYSEALPSGAPSYLLNDIQTLNPQQAKAKLDEVWVSHGFGAAKGETIGVNLPKLLLDIDSVVKKTSSTARSIIAGKEGVNVGKRIKDSVQEIIENALDGNTSGAIPGSVMVDIRSGIGRIVNSLSDDKFAVKQVLDPVQDYIDDFIIKNLDSDDAVRQFIKDRELWRVKSTLDDAVGYAVNKKSAFTADDWIKANASQSRVLAGRGRGLFQKEAEEIRDLAIQRDEQIKAVARKSAEKIRAESRKAINEEKLALSRQKKALALELREAQKEATDRYQSSAKSARDKAELDERLAEAKERHSMNLSTIDSEIKAIESAQKAIKSLRPKENTIFEQLFATNIVASGLAAFAIGPAAGAGVALSGIAGAGIAATQRAQRVLAGQTRLQQVGAKMSDRLNDVVEKLSSRYGTNVPSVIAATVGEGQRQDVVFNEAAKESIMRAPRTRQAQLYMGLVRNGTIERVKQQDAQFYRQLKSAYDSYSRTGEPSGPQ